MRKFFATVTISAALAATPALAQSSASGGLYVGALGGYEGIDVDAADGSATASADSAFVGVEGELSTSGGDTQFPSTFTGARDSLDANGQYYLGARAGFALTPGIAAYGKVGYTSLSTKAFTSSGSLAELEDNSGGIRFGGGVQVALPGPLEGRLEYRHSRYKDLADGTYGDATTDQVVAGLGVRF